jgi:hypothetical protein
LADSAHVFARPGGKRGETMDYSQAIEAMQVLERVNAAVAP